jgi:hypothetical protein
MPFQTGGNDVVATFGADLSGFDKGVTDVESKLDNLVRGMSGQLAGAAAGIGALTIPILALGKGLLDIGIEFDDAFDKIRIGTGQTGDILAGLEQSFRNVVASVPTDFEKASTAITTLAQRTGLTGTALETLAKQELELSRITKTDLNANIAASTRMFQDWSSSITSPVAAMDTLFKVFQQTGISVTRLAELVVQFGAPLRSLGFNFDEAAALMGKFEKEGVNITTVLGAMRIGLSKFKGQEASAAFADLIDKIKNAKTETEALSIGMTAFGKRGGADLTRAIIEGRFNLDELQQKLKESQETILETARRTMDFSERLTLLGSQAKIAAEPLAAELFGGINGLMDPLEKLVEGLGFLVNMFVALPPEIKNAAEAFVVGGAAIAGIITILTGVVAAGMLVVSLLGGPLTAAFAALVIAAGLMSAGIAFEWDRIKQIFEGGSVSTSVSLKQIVMAMGGFADGLAVLANIAVQQFDMITTAAKAMVIGVSGAFTALKTSMAPVLAGIVTGNMTMFASGLLNMGTVTQTTLGAIGQQFSNLKGRLATDTAEIAAHMNGKFVVAFANAFDSASSKVGELRDKMDQAMKDMATAMDKGGKGAGAHGKAHADAAEKAAKAWTIAQLQMKEDLTKIAELHQKTGEMILAIKLKQDQDWLKQNMKWGTEALKELQDFQKKQDDALSKVIDSKAGLAALEILKKLTTAVKTFATESGLATAKAALETRNNIQSAINTFTEYGVMLGKTGQQLEQFVNRNVRESLMKIAGITKEAADAAIKAAKDALIKLPGVWGEAFDKLPASVKGPMNSVLGIIETMPGKFGEVARGVLKTAETWIKFTDSVLASMHKLNSDIPATLGELVVSMGVAFKKIFKSANDAQKDGEKESEDGANKWAARITGIINGAVMYMSTRHQGLAKGILGGAMAGVTAGAAFGPVGAAVGGVVGAIAGIFGSGKSQAEKDAEAKAKKDAEVQTETAIANLTQGIMDGLEKGRQLLEGLRDFAAVPKESIKKFFAQLQTVLTKFVEMAATFKTDAIAQAKLVSESLGPVFEFLANAVNFTKMAREIEEVTDGSIASLMSAISRVEAGFEKVTAELEMETVKRSSKMAAKLTDVFSFVTIIPDALKALNTTPNLPEGILETIFQSATKIIDRFSELVDQFHDYSMNKLAKSSKQFTTVFESVTALLGTLKALGEYQPIGDEVLTNVTTDFTNVLNAISGWIDLGNQALEKALNLEDVVRRLRESLNRALGGLSTAATAVASGAATASLSTSSVTTSSVDQSIHIGGVSLAPGQAGYEEIQGAVAAIQRTLGGLQQTQRAY